MTDQDGYITTEELERIKNWDYHDLKGLMDFVRSVWWAADWGWHQDGDTYHISTGGWSGNELIIDNLQENWKKATVSLCKVVPSNLAQKR